MKILSIARCDRCGKHKEVLEDGILGAKVFRICKKCLSEWFTFFATHSKEDTLIPHKKVPGD